MKKQLMLVGNVIREHPQLLKVALNVAWRNTTNLIDYNFMSGRSFRPKAVTFRISGQCNLNCRMCIYRNSGFLDTAKMLPLPIFKRVIDEVYPFKLFVVFTGGEPLMHPHIIECLQYTKEKGLHCSLTTNGLALAEYAEEIVESGLDTLGISIDGPEKVHNRIRGRTDSYQRAFEGIQKVKSFEKRPLIFINTSIQTDSYAHIDRLVDEANEAGVDGMNVQVLWTRPPDRATLHNRTFPEYPVRDGWADETLLQIDFNKLEDVLRKARESSLFVNVFPSFSLQQMHTWYTDPAQLLRNRRPKCPWMMANVFHDGTMRMCDDVIMGDLEEDSFWKIWNNERMVKFRKILKENKHFPICAGCCSMYRDHIM